MNIPADNNNDNDDNNSCKKSKTKHDRVDKVMPWELCKKFKYDHTNKLYMDNLESVQENGTNKLLWDFEIQTDHVISAKRADLVIAKKKKKKKKNLLDFTVPVNHRIKLKESEKTNKYLELARELEKNYGTWKWQWYQL